MSLHYLTCVANEDIHIPVDGVKTRHPDNTLGSLTIMMAEIHTEERNKMVNVIINLINKNIRGKSYASLGHTLRRLCPCLSVSSLISKIGV